VWAFKTYFHRMLEEIPFSGAPNRNEHAAADFP
jgi:hypothetical protein